MSNQKRSIEKIKKEIDSLIWYHTLDLGEGLITPGIYDHRPYLKYYGIPEDLKGKRVLDIGAASGFFTFELERRGAQVVATELPSWLDHDVGPGYVPDRPLEVLEQYLHQPFLFAKKVLGSKAKLKKINIYELSPKKIGMFDLVFCGSLLLHLTDPIQALWRIASVTKEVAIIATAILEDHGKKVEEKKSRRMGEREEESQDSCYSQDINKGKEVMEITGREKKSGGEREGGRKGRGEDIEERKFAEMKTEETMEGLVGEKEDFWVKAKEVQERKIKNNDELSIVRGEKDNDEMGQEELPLAQFVGEVGGISWWIPNRKCLEAWIKCAGFSRWKWYSSFRLDYRDGQPGTWHGVVHCFP